MAKKKPSRRKNPTHSRSSKQRSNSDVGYKKPPREHCWKPGQSGNPNGRPRGTSLTDRLRKALDDAEEGGQDIRKALIDAGLRSALRGDFRFWKEIYERLDGKIPDRVAGHDGGPLKMYVDVEECDV